MIKSVVRFIIAGLLMEASAAYAMGGDPWFHTQGSNYSLENFGLRSYFLGERSDYEDIAPSANLTPTIERSATDHPPADLRRGGR
jgi:hypothetical protein